MKRPKEQSPRLRQARSAMQAIPKPASEWPDGLTMFDPELSSERIATAQVGIMFPVAGDHVNGTNVSVEIHTEPDTPGFEHAVTLFIVCLPIGVSLREETRECFHLMDYEIDAFASALQAAVRQAKATGVLAPKLVPASSRGAAA
jgi:hypothetical protein